MTVKQLRARLVAEPSTESDLVTLRVQDTTAQGAVELAKAVGQAYEETARARPGTRWTGRSGRSRRLGGC